MEVPSRVAHMHIALGTHTHTETYMPEYVFVSGPGKLV